MSRDGAPRVRDVMSNVVLAVVPEMTLRELVLTLTEGGVRSAPVLNGTGKPVGIVSSEDVLRRLLTSEMDLDGVRVESIMRPAEPMVGPEDTVSSLVPCFVALGSRRVLVMEHDILVGIVTPVDALRGLGGA
jgi:CBS domain-containing protein